MEKEKNVNFEREEREEKKKEKKKTRSSRALSRNIFLDPSRERASRGKSKSLLSLSFRFVSIRDGALCRFLDSPHHLRASSLRPLPPHEEARRQRTEARAKSRAKPTHLFVDVRAPFMPPLQRHLPSAWDRGGLLGPRGNARFLEVDGLRVKYTGRLVVLFLFFLEEEGDGDGRRKDVATLAAVFSSHVHFGNNAPCCFCAPWNALLRRSEKKDVF